MLFRSVSELRFLILSAVSLTQKGFVRLPAFGSVFPQDGIYQDGIYNVSQAPMDFYGPAIKTEARSNPASWTSFPSIKHYSNRRLSCMF